MTELDEQERLALDHFLQLLEEERCEPRPNVDRRGVLRGPEGQIIVPVSIGAEKPDLHLALLMEHKAEQIYKQTGCRFVLAQRPEQDSHRRTFIWSEARWRTFS